MFYNSMGLVCYNKYFLLLTREQIVLSHFGREYSASLNTGLRIHSIDSSSFISLYSMGHTKKSYCTRQYDIWKYKYWIQSSMIKPLHFAWEGSNQNIHTLPATILILSTSNRIPIRRKSSPVYFLLQVLCIILLFCQIVLLFEINVVLMLPWWPDVTIVQSDVTIVVPW